MSASRHHAGPKLYSPGMPGRQDHQQHLRSLRQRKCNNLHSTHHMESPGLPAPQERKKAAVSTQLLLSTTITQLLHQQPSALQPFDSIYPFSQALGEMTCHEILHC